MFLYSRTCFMFKRVHKLKEELSTSTQTDIERCTKEVKIEHLSVSTVPKKAGAAPGHEL